jgi:hypothetical protein
VKSYSSWNAFFLLTFTAFGYSNNQREATLITKCEVAKAKFWESLTFMFLFLQLSLTFISYSFWNTRRKVLKKIAEKRAITPRWVMGFTSKLQGR